MYEVALFGCTLIADDELPLVDVIEWHFVFAVLGTLLIANRVECADEF